MPNVGARSHACDAGAKPMPPRTACVWSTCSRSLIFHRYGPPRLIDTSSASVRDTDQYRQRGGIAPDCLRQQQMPLQLSRRHRGQSSDVGTHRWHALCAQAPCRSHEPACRYASSYRARYRLRHGSAVSLACAAQQASRRRCAYRGGNTTPKVLSTPRIWLYRPVRMLTN